MSRIAVWWGKYFLSCELVLGAAIGIAVGIWAERLGGRQTLDAVLQGNRGTLYGTLASVLGALLGFAITAVSIIMTVADAPALSGVRDTPHYETLWRTFMSTIHWLGVATCSALVCLFIDNDHRTSPGMSYVMTALFAIAALRTWRCVWILEHVVRAIAKPRAAAKSSDGAVV